MDHAIELAFRHHPEAQHGEHEVDEAHVAKAEAIVDRVVGRKRTLRDALEAQSRDAERRPSTEEKYKHALGLLLKFIANQDARPEHVTRDTALRFVDWLNHEAKTVHDTPYAPQTKQNMMTGLASLWDYLMHRRQIPEGPNIWHGHKITGKEKPHDAPNDDEDVRPFTDAEIVKLLHGPDVREGARTRYTKRTILEVFALAFYTGARLDEIVSRKVLEVEKQGRGYLFRITSGKTPESRRAIPIVHPVPVAILTRRLKGRKDHNAQVFGEFIAGGYDGKPAKSASKAILGYRQKVELIGATNFHSTRKNFYTRLMELDVNNDWYSMYIGHSLGGMAKVYGKRTPVILTNVAKAISYPKKIEAAFRKALGV